jgi:hypothetical protein
MEAFDYKCDAFIKVTRRFEEIFREIKALIWNLLITRLFEDTFNGIEAFLNAVHFERF